MSTEDRDVDRRSPPPPKPGREARLAQALRDNLRRRKTAKTPADGLEGG